MTRINLIPPSELFDQHLVAEYRETFMVVAALRRSLNRKSPFDPVKEIPKRFTLNSGHVKFFYDKLIYLENRYKSLIQEMLDRGMKPDPNRTFPPLCEFPEWCKQDWQPSVEELEIIRAYRI
jgi:deoxyribonuclease (pyrimidine dimer)